MNVRFDRLIQEPKWPLDFETLFPKSSCQTIPISESLVIDMLIKREMGSIVSGHILIKVSNSK